MNEVTVENVKTYEDLKSQLNIELNKAAISFVRIGYLLKTARDTEILKDTEYSDVNEFASKEFGLDKSQVSRFMRINDRFSISGYSEQLKVEYEGYGSAKLSLMLTLPDEINKELSPEMSKSDILAVKEEYEEEKNTTPIEHMTEDTSDVPDDLVAAVVKQLNDEHPEPAELLHELVEEIGRELTAEDSSLYANDIKEYYMPDGDKAYIVNIPGRGRHMIKCTEEQLMITSMLDMKKTPLSWEDFAAAVIEDISCRDFKKTEDKPQAKTKPKKVEKSQAAKKTKKEEPKTAPTACQPAGPVEVWEEDKETEVMPKPEEPKEAAGEEENSEAAGEEESTEAAGELTGVRKQVADKLDQVKQEVIDGESWEVIRDHIRDISKFITLSTF